MFLCVCVCRERERAKSNNYIFFLIGLERKPVALHIDEERIDPSDFDCVLCCRTLWKPVTTPCGHSYCSMCLDRCLDYSAACPLCMMSLSNVSKLDKEV